MYILKLGGSAITDKTKPYTYRRGRVAKVAKALSGQRAVLIHGAGSFAHPHVKTFGLTNLGVALTKASLRRLTAYVVEELADAGAAAMPIEPSEIFWGKTLARGEVINYALERGMYPLLHGDIVPSDGGYAVLSGDDIALELAKAYRPKAVAFLMDVDGIYTAPPGTPGARRVEVITDLPTAAAGGVDVTGGVRKKVEVGLEIAKLGTPVYYCSIDDVEAVRVILTGGRPASCTATL